MIYVAQFKVAEGRAVAVKDVDTLPPKVRQALGVLTAMGRPEKVLEEVASRSTSVRGAVIVSLFEKSICVCYICYKCRLIFVNLQKFQIF